MTPKRRLRDINEAEKCVGWADELGRVTDDIPEEPISGVCCQRDGVLFAFYLDAGELILQIGKQRFPISSESLRIHYRHDFDLGVTSFRIDDGEARAELSYPAWWSEIGLSAEQVRFKPEEDEDEDYLAFVATVARDPEMQHGLVRAWSR